MLAHHMPRYFKMNLRIPSTLFVLLSCLFFSACAQEETTPKPADTYFTLKLGEKEFSAQLALARPEQQKGLMFRREMGENQGMLFIFEQTKQMGFWMKNTYIPLDIGYIDPDGILREVHKMFPHDERPVPSKSDNILMALEMNQGWFASQGLKVGDQLDMELVKQACKARGYPNRIR